MFSEWVLGQGPPALPVSPDFCPSALTRKLEARGVYKTCPLSPGRGPARSRGGAGLRLPRPGWRAGSRRSLLTGNCLVTATGHRSRLPGERGAVCLC